MPPINLGIAKAIAGKEKLSAAIAEGVDKRRAAATADVILNLSAGPIEVAGVVERGEPLQDFLVRCAEQLRNVRRPQKAMPCHLADDFSITVGDLKCRGRIGAAEPRPAAMGSQRDLAHAFIVPVKKLAARPRPSFIRSAQLTGWTVAPADQKSTAAMFSNAQVWNGRCGGGRASQNISCE